jgi:hypothetical protein
MNDQEELLWRQYQQHVDTYKFYLDLVVKLMSLYFAISGAIVSYFATNAKSPHAELALYLPLVMGIGLFIFFAIGASLSWVTRNDVFEIRNKLALDVSPELGVLSVLLIIFSTVLLVCICGLAYVLFCSAL